MSEPLDLSGEGLAMLLYRRECPVGYKCLAMDCMDCLEIYGAMEEKPMTKESNRVAELEAELARAMYYISAQKSCDTCKHCRSDMQFCAADCGKCCQASACTCADCFDGSKWEWKGAAARA